jgi:hypothetical protein
MIDVLHGCIVEVGHAVQLYALQGDQGFCVGGVGTNRDLLAIFRDACDKGLGAFARELIDRSCAVGAFLLFAGLFFADELFASVAAEDAVVFDWFFTFLT